MRAIFFVLAAFLCGAVYCNDDCTNFKTEVDGALQKVIDPASTLLSEEVPKILDPVFEVKDKVINALLKILGLIPDSFVLNAAKSSVKVGVDGINKAVEVNKSLLTEVSKKLTGTLETVLNPVLGIVSSISSQICSLVGEESSKCVGDATTTAVGLVEELSKGVNKCVDDLLTKTKEVVKAAVKPIEDSLSTLDKTLTDITSCKTQGIFKSAACIAALLLNLATTTLSSVLGSLTTVLQNLVSDLEGIVAALTSCLGGPASALQSGLEDVLKTVKKCVSENATS